MNEIEHRKNATTATLKHFEGKPFDWATHGTCIHMMRYHAAAMGHSLPIVPKFRTALTAKKALKETGFNSLSDLLDSYFPRIPPAFMRAGDVMALPGDAGFDAIVVRASVDKWIGWHEDVNECTLVVADMNAAIGAWRL